MEVEASRYTFCYGKCLKLERRNDNGESISYTNLGASLGGEGAKSASFGDFRRGDSVVMAHERDQVE